MASFIKYQTKTIKRIILHEFVWIQKDYDNLATYIPLKQLRLAIKETINAIKNEPVKVERVRKKTVDYSADYFNFAKDILKIELKKLSNIQLADLYKKLILKQRKSHAYASLTTWLVDSDGEDFSNFLINKLKVLIKNKKIAINLSEIFSILTTPKKLSFILKEEIELLKILKQIVGDKKARRIFLSKDIEKISENFKNLDNSLRLKILKHYIKWRWVPFTYISPAYELDYYLQVWSGLLRQKFNISKRFDELKNYSLNLSKQKNKIFEELNLTATDKRLFDVAAEIIWLKAYRKDCLFHGMYVLDKILREVAKRLHLSLKQTRFMADWEVAPALKSGGFPADILNERIKFSVYYQKDNEGIIYAGERAKKFLVKLNLEKEKIKKTNRLEGTSACPGKVSGRVKIVNLPEEMGKMNKGDIMVSHTTFPSLVPAMKKAAAIVTDDGGITCHAAIVSRELKIPCVVGTKIATKVLKDGDKVEVDADKGVVKILKNKL